MDTHPIPYHPVGISYHFGVSQLLHNLKNGTYQTSESSSFYPTTKEISVHSLVQYDVRQRTSENGRDWSIKNRGN